MHSRIATWLLSLPLTFLVIEIGVRLSADVTLAPVNFVERLHDFFLINGGNEFDPVAGWHLKSGMWSKNFNTSADGLGIRMNSAAQTMPVFGGILDVGDSFAAGSEVDDDQTMEAALTDLSRIPVLNAGAGGYAPDQAMLRATDLAEHFPKPAAIIIDETEDQVQDLLLTSYGGARKPYFTIEGGKLVPHNQPVPTDRPDIGLFNSVTGYSYLYTWLALRFDHEDWLGAKDTRRDAKLDDYVPIACTLLWRFSVEWHSQNIIPVWLVRYPGQYVDHIDPEQMARIAKVNACADNARWLVIDTYTEFLRLAREDRPTFDRLYNHPSGQYGHMSPEGNALVARLVWERLGPVLGKTE